MNTPSTTGQQASPTPTSTAGAERERDSTMAMIVARLEKMRSNGDTWLTIAAVLALLNDCDMRAAR
jgi:hypothetical protein